MSFSIGIHLWWDSGAGEDLGTFAGVLDCISIPETYREIDGSHQRAKRFGEAKVFDRCFAEVSDDHINSNDVGDVMKVLNRYRRRDVCYRVNSVFNFLDCDLEQKNLYTSAGPLDVIWYGSDYCFGGSYYKSYGPIRISFSSVDEFVTDSAFCGGIAERVSQGNELTESAQIAGRLKGNYDGVIVDLARKIIANLNPTHLLVCTEAEVHPLTCHTIYHKEWKEFLSDLQKIAILHEDGGNYFCTVSENDPAFQLPRKLGLDYGYLRGRFGDGSAGALVQKLQPMADKVLARPEELNCPRSLVSKCFAALKNTFVEEVGEGYLITAHDSPSSYLAEPYFKLFETIMAEA